MCYLVHGRDCDPQIRFVSINKLSHKIVLMNKWKVMEIYLHFINSSLLFNILVVINIYFLVLPYNCYSVTRSCPTICNPMDWNTQCFPILYYLPEFAKTHVHWRGNVIQPFHPLLSPSHPASIFPSLRVFQWISSLHQVAKVLEFQHQSFQLIFRVDFL